ncbi:hypothetical protein NTGBS_730001 [Candidatus Nitrotoga sp. BS]|nr:hypothetical protein NTGBS_730001 [Candidatus Nitrotoga sp. BS]
MHYFRSPIDNATNKLITNKTTTIEESKICAKRTHQINIIETGVFSSKPLSYSELQNIFWKFIEIYPYFSSLVFLLGSAIKYKAYNHVDLIFSDGLKWGD